MGDLLYSDHNVALDNDGLNLVYGIDVIILIKILTGRLALF